MKRPHPLSVVALVVAVLALVTSLGGTSIAAKLITGKDIKDNSVTSKDIKNNSVSAKDVKSKSLTGKQVKDGSLGAADLAPGTLPKFSLKRVVATPGADQATARSVAAKVVLGTKGPLTVYAKCFTDVSGPTTYAEVYVESSVAGAIFDADSDEQSGPAAGDFLEPATPEVDRQINTVSTGANDVDFQGEGDTEFTAIAGTTVLAGDVGLGAKNGTLAGGDGVYGAGDACLFTSSFVTS
jgi:hypothetical protein